MRPRVLVVTVLALLSSLRLFAADHGFTEYVVTVTGARSLKKTVRVPADCHLLTQFGLKSDTTLFGFQFDGKTPCGQQTWKNEKRAYDHDALTEVYIGVAGDEDVPGFDRAQFANNAKARSSVVLNADRTGTITFDNLENAHREYVSGTITFRFVPDNKD